MLDPPITQADIDAGTVFVRRDGEQTTLANRINWLDIAPNLPWISEDGRWYGGSGIRLVFGEGEYDLIARKPKESGMSHVVLENRINNRKVLNFADLPQNTIFTTKATPNYIRVKLVWSDSHLCIGPDGTVATIVNHGSGGEFTQCIPRPDLRLRLVLESV